MVIDSRIGISAPDLNSSRFILDSGIHSVQSPGSAPCRGLQSKRYILCGCVWKITFNPRLEQVRIVTIGEVIS